MLKLMLPPVTSFWPILNILHGPVWFCARCTGNLAIRPELKRSNRLIPFFLVAVLQKLLLNETPHDPCFFLAVNLIYSA